MESTHPEAVIFDLGGVLCTAPEKAAALSAAIGADPSVVEAAYWSERDNYDLGSTPEYYWTKVLSLIGVTASAALIARLDQIDSTTWARLDPDAASYLRPLQAARIRLGVLSNAPRTLAQTVRAAPWAEIFEVLCFSSDMQIAKPDPRIYQHLTRTLACEPKQITFIDDRPENVHAAQQAGWNAHLWLSHDHAATLLRNHVLNRLG